MTSNTAEHAQRAPSKPVGPWPTMSSSSSLASRGAGVGSGAGGGMLCCERLRLMALAPALLAPAALRRDLVGLPLPLRVGALAICTSVTSKGRTWKCDAYVARPHDCLSAVPVQILARHADIVAKACDDAAVPDNTLQGSWDRTHLELGACTRRLSRGHGRGTTLARVLVSFGAIRLSLALPALCALPLHSNARRRSHRRCWRRRRRAARIAAAASAGQTAVAVGAATVRSAAVAGLISIRAAHASIIARRLLGRPGVAVT